MKTFPFVLIGNKVDRESERKVTSQKAEAWCKENDDMLYFETSAKEGVSVNEAFIEMVKKGIARESTNQILMPDSIGGASGGGIKLQAGKKDSKRGGTNVKGTCC